MWYGHPSHQYGILVMGSKIPSTKLMTILQYVSLIQLLTMAWLFWKQNHMRKPWIHLHSFNYRTVHWMYITHFQTHPSILLITCYNQTTQTKALARCQVAIALPTTTYRQISAWIWECWGGVWEPPGVKKKKGLCIKAWKTSWVSWFYFGIYHMRTQGEDSGDEPSPANGEVFALHLVHIVSHMLLCIIPSPYYETSPED